MSTSAPAEPLRIGDVAQRVGTTPRTIRYYEEIGLLPASEGRVSGAHRQYSEADVERLEHVLRLKDLLGVSLDQLKELVEAEAERAALRAEYHAGADPARQAEILRTARRHLDRQLELVRARQAELAGLEAELGGRRERVLARLGELGTP